MWCLTQCPTHDHTINGRKYWECDSRKGTDVGDHPHQWRGGALGQATQGAILEAWLLIKNLEVWLAGFGPCCHMVTCRHMVTCQPICLQPCSWDMEWEMDIFQPPLPSLRHIVHWGGGWKEEKKRLCGQVLEGGQKFKGNGVIRRSKISWAPQVDSLCSRGGSRTRPGWSLLCL